MSKVRKYYNNLSPEIKSQIKNIVTVNHAQGWAATRGYSDIADILFPCDDIASYWGRHRKEDKWAGYFYHYVSRILFYEELGYSITELYKTV